MTIHASRRDVLKGGGALVVSFSLAGALGEALAQGAKPLALTEVDSLPGDRCRRRGDAL